MGYYINPPDCSKEDFLNLHGTRISDGIARSFDFSGNYLPVCLIHNGAFTAAAIGFCPQEVDACLQPDGRLKIWFVVSRDNLRPYFDGGAHA